MENINLTSVLDQDSGSTTKVYIYSEIHKNYSYSFSQIFISVVGNAYYKVYLHTEPLKPQCPQFQYLWIINETTGTRYFILFLVLVTSYIFLLWTYKLPFSFGNINYNYPLLPVFVVIIIKSQIPLLCTGPNNNRPLMTFIHLNVILLFYVFTKQHSYPWLLSSVINFPSSRFVVLCNFIHY